MKDIVVGRSAGDYKKFGLRGTILLGKQYVKMGQTESLSNNVYLDVAGAHVVFICGKRGGGKSFTMGVVAEGFHLLEQAVKQNLSIILLDTMGIYWTMKYPNKHEAELLDQWGLSPQSVPIKIFTPFIHYEEYKKKGIPTDAPFSVDASMIDQDDWCLAFHQDKYSPNGILIARTVNALKRKGGSYTVQDIIDHIRNDPRAQHQTKEAVESMFQMAEGWGVFSENGTQLDEIAKGGQITVLDLSCYATMPGGWDIKSLIIGILGQHLFVQRMVARKQEEFDSVSAATSLMSDGNQDKQDMPLVWLVVDEAHEFLPKDKVVASTDALVTIMREGRQPGISLILATQQPGKIHTDVMTQSDTVLSHRLTAKMDVEALSLLMQSYMREGLSSHIDSLPRVKGSGVLFDDNNERLYSIRVRPRITWHGGSSPTAIPEDESIQL